MAETLTLMPALVAVPCDAVEASSFRVEAGPDVDLSRGAVGVAHLNTPDIGPCLFLSIQLPDGKMFVARLPEEAMFAFVAALGGEIAALSRASAEQLTN